MNKKRSDSASNDKQKSEKKKKDEMARSRGYINAYHEETSKAAIKAIAEQKPMTREELERQYKAANPDYRRDE